MRVVVIGGTGHIGTYLVPRLLADGHEVVSVSRGRRSPYPGDAGALGGGVWTAVEQVRLDREEAERGGTFAGAIRALQPDAVIDLVCFSPESARHLMNGLRGAVGHFLHCGTIWVHGPTVAPPTTEDAPRRPFGEYGIRKATIEAMLLRAAAVEGFPATVLHPGHIVGPGWVPVNPQGNWDVEVFGRLARGEPVCLPDIGLYTLHHVHADDVALAFQCALRSRATAVGESFHVCAPAALTLRGYAEAVAGWFGREARLTYAPWEEWRAAAGEERARQTWDHVAHSPCVSIAKAARLLGFQPRYSGLEAVRQSLEWLVAQKRVRVS